MRYLRVKPLVTRMWQMAKARYRIRNWSEYNRSLVARGDVMLWLDEQVLNGWYWTGTLTRSGNPLVYGDVAIQCALAVRALFHLPLRGTRGLLRSILQLAAYLGEGALMISPSTGNFAADTPSCNSVPATI